MKKLIIAIMCLSLFGLTGTALAGQPKVDVAHCGCNDDGTDLVWTFLSVSVKSRGHQQHDAGDLEDCVDEAGAVVDTFVRGADDCVLFGEEPINGVAICVEPIPVEGESCAAE
jgi:hypothetical protein